MSTRPVLAVTSAAMLGLGIGLVSLDALACGECRRARNAVSTAVHQADTNLSHGVEKLKTETTNLGQNTEEAVRESGRYVRHQGEVLVDAHEQLLKGDLYGAQKTYVNGSIDNSVTALQQSSMLRVGATVLASAYGGPLAVGALNGVLVYKTTGDEHQAWKTGFISAGSSWATGQISAYKPTTADQIVGSAVANGTVSGAATGALGGDFEKGFERGALGSLANTWYQHVTNDSPDETVPQGAPHPKDSLSFETKEDALAMMDTLERNRPWTGEEVFKLDMPQSLGQAWKTNPFGVTEDTGLMMTLSKIPVVNPGSVFHDYLAVDNSWVTPTLQITIPPAFAVTGIAMHLPERELLYDSAIDNAERRDN